MDTHHHLLNALESALRLLEQKSAQKADAGACLWQDSGGYQICVRLTQEDCEKIPGLRFIGGTCKEVAKNTKI